MDVNVIVIDDLSKNTPGVIDDDVPLAQVREDIVAALGLNPEDDWEVAVGTSSISAALRDLHRAGELDLFVFSRRRARGTSFKRR